MSSLCIFLSESPAPDAYDVVLFNRQAEQEQAMEVDEGDDAEEEDEDNEAENSDDDEQGEEEEEEENMEEDTTGIDSLNDNSQDQQHQEKPLEMNNPSELPSESSNTNSSLLRT